MRNSTDPSTAATNLLPPEARRRGRRLAVLSHPAGMTHRTIYTEQLPTLALVGLGASEALVGLQRAFEPFSQLLQLGALRAVGRVRMRAILLAGQALAVVAGLPLAAYGALAAAGPEAGPAIALASLALCAAGIVIGNAVWFPLLRGYVEPGRIGHFFGILRTGWHLTLIAYFVAAERWLAAHPGSFGPLFAAASVAGLLRIALVARLPEADGSRRDRLRVRDALGLLRTEPRLRRYLAGMTLYGAARRAATPFAIVMMRRTLGLTDADVALATAAFYGGGFASLYGWGRAVDRFGPLPVFRLTAVGTATLLAAFGALGGEAGPLAMIGFFFLLAVLNAGFGVADTHVLFGLAPDREPTPTLVVADVVTSLAYGAGPFVAGLLLAAALEAGTDAGSAYRVLFFATAALSAASPLPLRRFRDSAS
jgi:predicted MFS family arabinose efflux permease